jgi:hypothetical protein
MMNVRLVYLLFISCFVYIYSLLVSVILIRSFQMRIYIYLFISIQILSLYLLSDPRWYICCCSFILFCINSVYRIVFHLFFNYLEKREMIKNKINYIYSFDNSRRAHISIKEPLGYRLIKRYVQISKKGNYGNFHNFQKHVNSMKSIFEKFLRLQKFRKFRKLEIIEILERM